MTGSWDEGGTGPGWGAPGQNPPGQNPPAQGPPGQGPPPPGAPPPPGYGAPGEPPFSSGYAAPGYPHPGGYGYPVQRQTNTQATLALVLGIVSLTMCWFLTGIPAIIIGHKARKEIARSGGTQDGDGFALAGLIMGWVSTVLSVLGIGAYIVVIVLVVAMGESSESRFEPIGPTSDYCNDYDEYTYNDC